MTSIYSLIVLLGQSEFRKFKERRKQNEVNLSIQFKSPSCSFAKCEFPRWLRAYEGLDGGKDSSQGAVSDWWSGESLRPPTGAWGPPCVCWGRGKSVFPWRWAGCWEKRRCAVWKDWGHFLTFLNLIFLIAVMNFLHLKMYFFRVSSIFALIYFIL